ncbi:MAG TPA: hypothetical protein VFR78_15025 [Pyrinomonadaceae bacterium]|nr:hypothetical protein [Pyrinomonadaceae bacterium]
MAVSPTQPGTLPRYWPSARYFTEAIQCPSVCFAHPLLRSTLPAVDRLGMPLVTSGQFAYVYKLNSMNGNGNFAVRCFRGYLGDRDQRYRAIQEHLRTSPVSYVSEFTYASEGILVGGHRFPILFMKWIDGPTLDIYIGEMLNRPDVLLHLSEEWLRVLSALRASGIAHGDLQHGNIIVEHGQLRLVDHDGIFVPRMVGWTASEVGHQHYQHPRREAQHFDEKLDNFSSLVIYLSLLSIAERPELWQEHHDENLIFTKADFNDPASSVLFKKIREIGPEHSRLADALAEAATGEPSEAPSILDLVKTKTALPTWMTAPVDLEAATKTREVVRTEAPQRTARWMPWQAKDREPSFPITPTSQFQSVFSGGAAVPQQPAVRNPFAVAENTLQFSKEFLKKYFLLWYWAAYIVLDFIGFDLLLSIFSAFVFLMVVCFGFGLVRAIDEALKASTRSSPMQIRQPAVATAPPPVPPPSIPVSWNQQIPMPPPPADSLITTVSDPFVGNRVLGIFHLETCDWVDRISAKNRVGFSTASEAASHGFKPCRICYPA